MEENSPDIAIEEVRKYLQGSMTPEEVIQFEDRMDKDPAFAEEVQLNRELLESMSHHFKGKLKERLKHEDKKVVFLGDKRGKPIWKRVLVMAASVALIAFASYFLFYGGPNNQELFDQYHTTYYNVVEGSTRSGDVPKATEAFKQYDQGDFKTAAESFGSLISQDPSNLDWIFYLGLANLEIQESDEGIDAFEKILEASTNEWLEPARWYLGLAYLQAGKIKNAKETFQQIASDGNSYSERAEKLLGKL